MQRHLRRGEAERFKKKSDDVGWIPGWKLKTLKIIFDPHSAVLQMTNAARVFFLLHTENMSESDLTVSFFGFYLVPGHRCGQFSHSVSPLFLQIDKSRWWGRCWFKHLRDTVKVQCGIRLNKTRAVKQFNGSFK